MTATRQVKVVLLNKHAKLPEYKTAGAVGADLFAAFDGPAVQINPGDRISVPVGIALELSDGIEAQIRSRSGLAIHHGVVVLNSPGTIDQDYRGEISVVLTNTSDVPFRINCGDRIAQMVIAPVLKVAFHESTQIDLSPRGSKGFGSTGI